MMNRTAIILDFLLAVLLAMTWQACVPDPPRNLEPLIELHDATDITRTGAVVAATVEYRGTGTFGMLRFRFGTSEAMESQVTVMNPVDETISVTFTGLKPGTKYFYCAEGINSGTGAIITSETKQFDTEPNERPSIADVKTLSSGPVGVIVGFEITDDGGEPLVDAGCDVTDVASGAGMRYLLPKSQVSVGKMQMYVSGMTAGKEYVIMPFASNSAGEAAGEPISFTASESISLLEPGVFKIVAGTVPSSGELVISGFMNGSDLHYLRQLLGAPLLSGEDTPEATASGVNLSDVTIVEGGESYDGSRFTENNIVSTGMFSDCSTLRRIALPATAVKIGRNAFSDCRRLESLAIPAAVREIIPSDGCVSLKSIAVQEANDVYRSFDGVLFNAAGTDMLWFPVAKTGGFAMPPSVTSISENAFRGTLLTSVELPQALTLIGRGAFSASALESITIPPLITNIPEGMTQDCGELMTVRLGSGVNFIGDYAFAGCSLLEFHVEADFPPVVSGNAFDGTVSEQCTLYVPAGSVAIYRNHAVWGKFKKITAE